MGNALHEIASCEVCGNETLVPVLDLGSHPMCDDLVPIGDGRVCREYPIEILFCNNCLTAHQRFQVPKHELFPASYHYRSRFTADVLAGMQGLVSSSAQRLGSLSGKRVLDIGCNDGSLLDFFRKEGATTIGIEPTDAFSDAEAKGHITINAFLSEEVAGLSDESEVELFDGEPIGVYALPIATDELPLDAFDLLPALIETPATAPEPVAVLTAPAAEAIVDEAFADSPEPPRADIEPWVPMYLTPGRIWPALEGMPSETPAPRTEQPDWIELVASLRQDLERRRIDPPPPARDPIAVRPSDGAESDVPRAKKQKPQAKKSKPIQDEWGFFDPEQCGFSTLLAKLEEITEEEVRS